MAATSKSMPYAQVSDFEEICRLIRHDRLLCVFFSSGQRFAGGFHQTPQLTVGTLTVQLTLSPVWRLDALHLQVGSPCQAHNQKRDD
jgi:hypothetical protein